MNVWDRSVKCRRLLYQARLFGDVGHVGIVWFYQQLIIGYKVRSCIQSVSCRCERWQVSWSTKGKYTDSGIGIGTPKVNWRIDTVMSPPKEAIITEQKIHLKTHHVSISYPTMQHFCNRNVHTCAHFWYKVMHGGIFVSCIVGIVRWIHHVCSSSVYHITTLIARFLGPKWAHLGPTGPMWVPCWPHELCYMGSQMCWFHVAGQYIQLTLITMWSPRGLKQLLLPSKSSMLSHINHLTFIEAWRVAPWNNHVSKISTKNDFVCNT